MYFNGVVFIRLIAADRNSSIKNWIFRVETEEKNDGGGKDN
jgi:hypothetical protein